MSIKKSPKTSNFALRSQPFLFLSLFLFFSIFFPLSFSFRAWQHSRIPGVVVGDLWRKPVARLWPAGLPAFGRGTCCDAKHSCTDQNGSVRHLPPSLRSYPSTFPTEAVCAQQPRSPRAALGGRAKLASPPTSQTIPGYALAALLMMM